MGTREEVIAGLRELVEFLADNPEIPLTAWNARLSQPVAVHAADDQVGLAELRRIAGLLGVEVDHKHGSVTHWYATRRFGPAEYEATYVARDHMKQVAEEDRWLAERRAGEADDV